MRVSYPLALLVHQLELVSFQVQTQQQARLPGGSVYAEP